jgi:uncharacterized membrane protein YeaQ/YmgE (transglycosylase-associated protein family)
MPAVALNPGVAALDSSLCAKDIAMKMIALAAVVAMFLLGLFGTDASVGGPMGMMMVAVVAMLAAGIQEAASNGRGPLGWIVSIVAAIVGGFVAVMLFGNVVMEMIVPMLNLNGSLASSHNPMKYILFAAMGAITVLGSWGALQIINLLRQKTVRRASEG